MGETNIRSALITHFFNFNRRQTDVQRHTDMNTQLRQDLIGRQDNHLDELTLVIIKAAMEEYIAQDKAVQNSLKLRVCYKSGKLHIPKQLKCGKLRITEHGMRLISFF